MRLKSVQITYLPAIITEPGLEIHRQLDRADQLIVTIQTTNEIQQAEIILRDVKRRIKDDLLFFSAQQQLALRNGDPRAINRERNKCWKRFFAIRERLSSRIRVVREDTLRQ